MTIATSVAILLLACGKNEPGTAHPGSDTAASESHELPPCNDADAIPLDARTCRLDLETGVDSHWKDTDGVDPGTAGCHEEFEDGACTTPRPGRTFGEFCLDEDRLVESNPGIAECHTHGSDLGHPDVVSCSAWCREQGSSEGRCQGGIAAEGLMEPCESARCECG